TEIECQAPLPPLNGRLLTSGPFKMWDVARFQCDKGYVIVGSPLVACQPEGSWSSTPPVCRVGCGYPELTVPRGQFSPIKFYYQPGDTVLATCAPGYFLQGEDKLACSSNGTWEGTPGNCTLAM
ncbi:unnamed protein product, partial [Darwinula stevensoni]